MTGDPTTLSDQELRAELYSLGNLAEALKTAFAAEPQDLVPALRMAGGMLQRGADVINEMANRAERK